MEQYDKQTSSVTFVFSAVARAAAVPILFQGE